MRLAQRSPHCHLLWLQKMRATATWTQACCWGHGEKVPPHLGCPAGRCPEDGQVVGARGLRLVEARTGVWGPLPQHWRPGPESNTGSLRTRPDSAGPRDRLTLCLGPGGSSTCGARLKQTPQDQVRKLDCIRATGRTSGEADGWQPAWGTRSSSRGGGGRGRGRADGSTG